MISYALVLFIILANTSQTHFLSSPDDPFTAGSLNTTSGCIELPPPGSLARIANDRLSGFKLTGTYSCERTIFEYGERDSYADYVVQHVEKRAQGVAQTLGAHFLATPTKLKTSSVTIEVLADDAALGHFVESVFSHELNNKLGSQSVRRAVTNPTYTPKLRIRLQRLQDPTDCFKVTLVSTDRFGDIQWLHL